MGELESAEQSEKKKKQEKIRQMLTAGKYSTSFLKRKIQTPFHCQLEAYSASKSSPRDQMPLITRYSAARSLLNCSLIIFCRSKELVEHAEPH